MTRQQIIDIAVKHGVDPSCIKGHNKEELLRNINGWYTNLADYQIILQSAGSTSKEYQHFAAKRDALRKELGIC